MKAARSLARPLTHRVVLVGLVLGILAGLAGMHGIVMGTSTDAMGAASGTHAMQSQMHAPSPMHRMAVVAHHTVSAVVAPQMDNMSHAMEMCCMALLDVLALAVLAAPSLLRVLGALRPRAQLPTVTPRRAMRGIERNLTLGVLRI